MKSVIAVALVACTLAAAEVPARQSAPYAPSGWRPAGLQFTLPLRTQPRKFNEYGPPKGHEVTTTELPITTDAATEEISTEDLQAEFLKNEPKRAKLEQSNSDKLTDKPKGQFYVVLPQGQNLLYTVPEQNAPLLALQRANIAVGPARLQTVLPFPAAISTTSIFTPFSHSSSYIRFYQ